MHLIVTLTPLNKSSSCVISFSLVHSYCLNKAKTGEKSIDTDGYVLHTLGNRDRSDKRSEVGVYVSCVYAKK